ncbi:L,D-transpeptidase [Rhodocyclus purpureus]|nr:L,D-transpeptidase [Rhodocyclus purpureus]
MSAFFAARRAAKKGRPAPVAPADSSPASAAPVHIDISLAAQTLSLLDAGGTLLARYPVSTAANGPGECADSGCTPRGLHLVRARIGAGLPANTVFRARRPTGEIYSPELARQFPERDWILTRILWLSGCEPGRNRGGKVDTMRRYIYIHGTPDAVPLGVPGSHGCIRMRNADIVELFDRVAPYTRVLIRD